MRGVPATAIGERGADMIRSSAGLPAVIDHQHQSVGLSLGECNEDYTVK